VRPTTYDELADVLVLLPTLVREKRRRQGLSLRAAAEAANVSFTVLMRFEQGNGIVLSNAIALLRWVGTP